MFETKSDTTETTAPDLDRARELERRGPPYTLDEFRVRVEAGRSLPDDEPLSSVDQGLVRASAQGGWQFPEPEPDPETPFDSELEDAEEAEAEATEAKVAAWDRVRETAQDIHTLTGCGTVMIQGGKYHVPIGDGQPKKKGSRPDLGHLRALEEKAEDLVREYERALEDWREARIAANEVRRKRSRWLNEARVEAA